MGIRSSIFLLLLASIFLLTISLISGGETTSPRFTSTEVEAYVRSLQVVSYAGNVKWSGNFEYTAEIVPTGFARWYINADKLGAAIDLIGIPANLSPEVEKAYWDKELVGTLYAVEWYGLHIAELPVVSEVQARVLIDGLALLALPPTTQSLLNANYPEDSYFSGSYLQWSGRLSCEHLFAIELMSRSGGITPGGVGDYLDYYDCPIR
jgi:hypothetical protein